MLIDPCEHALSLARSLGSPAAVKRTFAFASVVLNAFAMIARPGEEARAT